MMSTWYADMMGRALAQRGETFSTTEDLACVVGIEPQDDNAVELMFTAARAYHNAGGTFGDDDDERIFSADTD